jgi:outer membrane protein TolC
MNRKGLAVVLALSYLLFPTYCFAQLAERVLTLDESLTTGLQNSQDLMIAKEQISIAEQRVGESKALIYPKIDFNFSASQFQSDFPTVLAPTFANLYLPAGSANSYYSTRFSLWQYLYAGGRYTKNLQLAVTNLSQAQTQAEIVKNRTARNIKKAFYVLLSSKEKIGMYEAYITAAKTRFIPQARQGLLKAKYEYQKNQLELLESMGIELNTIIDVQGTLKAPEDDYDLNKCLAWAFQSRPELRQTQYLETMNTLYVNLSQIERKATISLGANYEWAGADVALNQRNWNATINMNFPVFDGWASVARTKQKFHQETESKIHRSEIEDQIRLDVRRSLMDYAFWKDQEASLNAKRTENTDPEKRLEANLLWLESAKQVLSSQADFEWAVGGGTSLK